MAEREKIAVKSTVRATVGINVPDLRLKREWRQKGAINYIDFEDLEQAMYDPGVEYMLKTGILYIEDMGVKVRLGLEAEETKKPTQIIVLDDKQKERYMSLVPIHEFKTMVDSISYEQQVELVNYAIEKKITDLPRLEYLKGKTQVDGIKSIMLSIDNEDVSSSKK